MLFDRPIRLEDSNDNAPLLDGSEDEDATPRLPPTTSRSWQSPKRILHVFLVAVTLVSLGDALFQSPFTRIQESVICYHYYEKADPSKILLDRSQVGAGAIGGVAEHECKVDGVQSALATLRGWQIFLDCIPSLLLAVPFGWGADKYGRKPFVLAGLTAAVLKTTWMQLVAWFWQSFNIRWMWLSTLFYSVGGGGAVTIAMAFVVLSDVTPEAERSAVFLRVGAFSLLAGLTMPPVAAWLMRYDPWISTIAGTFLMVLAVVLFAFTPETLNFGRGEAMSAPFPDSSSFEDFPPPSPDESRAHERGSATMADRWRAGLRSSTAFLIRDWRVPVLITPFVGYICLGVCGSFIIQYLSARYDLIFADATLVAVIYSAVMVVVMFILLPYASNVMICRLHFSAMRKDLWLLRGSHALLALGWMMFAFAPNVPVVGVTLAFAALGQGAPLLLRSFITSLLPSDQVATAYSAISVVDTLSTMAAAPLLAGLLKQGLALRGGWTGLPFIFTSLLMGMFTVVLFLVGLRKGEDKEDASAEENF